MDGIVVKSTTANMWNGGQATELNFNMHLQKGHHKLEVYGGEDCCDGTTKWSFKTGDGEWEDFTLRNL